MISNKYKLPKLIQEIDKLKICITMVETEYMFKHYSVSNLDQLSFNQLLGSFILSSFKLFQGISLVQLLSHVRLFVTPWTAACQVSLSFTISQSLHEFSSVQLLSRVRLFATPWTAASQDSLSITNSWSSPKLISIESVMPFNHLILCHPLVLLLSIFPSIRVFSSGESALHNRWPKYWTFSSKPSNEYSGLISLRIGWFDLLLSREFYKSKK